MNQACLALVALSILALAQPAQAQTQDWAADIAGIEQFLSVDKAFTPEEATRAQARLQDLRQRAPSMTRAQFVLAAAEIARLANNGHTMILPGAWAQLFNRAPVQFLALSEGLFVACSTRPELRGAEVLSIEGRSWADLQAAYARYESGEPGLRRRFIVHFLESPELLHAAGLIRRPDRMRLRVRDANGRRRTVALTAAAASPQFEGLEAYLPPDRLVEIAREGECSPWRQTPLYLEDAASDFRLAEIAEIDAAYIQLKFNAGEGLPPFLEATEANLRQRPRQTLILDLRFLIGGDLSVTRAFMSALPSMIDPQGRIYVIVSGSTFSAGMAAAGFVKQAGGDRVTIVGEPVGEDLEYWAETDSIDLPRSQATLLYATLRHNYRTGCPEQDCYRYMQRHALQLESLDPDWPTPLRFADVVAGRDPAFEAILAAERAHARPN